jgi:hypothetical protein
LWQVVATDRSHGTQPGEGENRAVPPGRTIGRRTYRQFSNTIGRRLVAGRRAMDQELTRSSSFIVAPDGTFVGEGA